MQQGRRVLPILLGMVMAIGACSSTDGDPGSTAGSTGTSGETSLPSTSSTPPGELPSEAADPEDPTPEVVDPEGLPSEVAGALETIEALPQPVAVEPALAAPGQRVSVSGGDGTGTLQLVGPEGPVGDPAAFGDPAGVTIPPDAPDGTYAVVIDGPSGIRGIAPVTVTSGPVMLIRIGRDGLHVTASGVDPGTAALVQIGEGADERYYEAAGSTLIPAGREPAATLDDYLTVPLRLPPTTSGAVTVIAVDDQLETVMRSNTEVIEACDEPTVLSGDLGGTGEVRAVWGGPNPGSTAASADGTYRMAVSPGLVAVTEVPLEGEPRSLLALARCGEETEVTDDGPAATGSYTPAGLGDDEWAGAVTGDLQAEFGSGIAICETIDEGLEVTLLDDFDLSFGVVATIDEYSGPGVYRAPGIAIDGTGGFSEGALTVETSIGEGGLVEGRLAGDFGGGLGSIGFEGAFRCALEHPLGFGEPAGLFASYLQTAGHEACKLGLVQFPEDAPAVGAAVARALADGVPLVEWNTTADMSALLGAAAQIQKQRLGDGRDQIEAARRMLTADFLVTVEILEPPGFSEQRRFWAVVKIIDTEHQALVTSYIAMGPDLQSLAALPGFETHPPKVAEVGICGFVDPEEAALAATEEVEISIEVVDLLDRPLDGAEVILTDREDGEFSESCAVPDETAGTTSSGGRFSTTFTAAETVLEDCVEHPRFRAARQTWLGEVATEPDRDRVDATVDVGARWEFFATLTARTPDGDQTWTFGTEDDPGFFLVREGGAILGGAPGAFDGVRSCEVHENGVLTYKEPPVDLAGTWATYLYGRLVDGEYFEFRIEGNAWSSNWPPLPPECAIVGMSEVGEGVLRLVAYRPDGFTVHPVNLLAEEGSVTFSIPPDALPDAELTITIKPVQAEPAG